MRGNVGYFVFPSVHVPAFSLSKEGAVESISWYARVYTGVGNHTKMPYTLRPRTHLTGSS